jgi:hypothetical protein
MKISVRLVHTRLCTRRQMGEAMRGFGLDRRKTFGFRPKSRHLIMWPHLPDFHPHSNGSAFHRTLLPALPAITHRGQHAFDKRRKSEAKVRSFYKCFTSRMVAPDLYSLGDSDERTTNAPIQIPRQLSAFRSRFSEIYFAPGDIC